MLQLYIIIYVWLREREHKAKLYHYIKHTIHIWTDREVQAYFIPQGQKRVTLHKDKHKKKEKT
jgi:hypothetical protein